MKELFDLDKCIFIYKTMFVVEGLYQAGVYTEDKEEVLAQINEIREILERRYPKEIKGNV